MPAPPLKFAELVSGWLTWLGHNRGRAAGTVEKYGQYLDRLADWCANPPDVAAHRASCADPLHLTAADLELFAGLYAHAQGLSPRARRPLVSAVRGFFGWAKASGHLTSNPAERLPSPRAGRRLPRAATLASAERLLMAPDVGTLPGLRDAAILAGLAGLGARVSGLCGLNESSLIWTGDGGLTVRLREKGKKERLVPAPQEFALLLRGYLAHPDLAHVDRLLEDGDKVLFVSMRAPAIPAHEYHGERRRLSPRAVGRMIETYAGRVGVPRDQAHPHALRHLYGAELAEDDADLVTRQALLGHVNAKDTEIYSHLAHRKLRKVVDQSNPLAKMRGPLLDSLRAVRSATAKA
ncbi:MAG TPA: tyrosine-type recombinase/integrase [Reyranellaceae bacterium]|nr:tyrosine-type recombinase/integrase [Reyranellaceae bacterium]